MSRGTQNVPQEGGLIVAPVHLSHIDPPAIACTLPRRVNFMAKEELFKVPIFGGIIKSLGSFPVRRGEGDTEAIRHTIGLLENGAAVLVFPEGTRGDGQMIQEMNKGVTLLAKRTGAWVQPVGIVGTHKVLPKGQSKPKRHPVTVAYGNPFRYSDFVESSDQRQAFADELEARIVQLCRENGLPIKSAPRPKSSKGSRVLETQA